MIRTESCTPAELATQRRGTPIPIHTVAGQVEVDQIVDVVVQSLDEGPMQFYVLDPELNFANAFYHLFLQNLLYANEKRLWKQTTRIKVPLFCMLR